MDDRMAGKDIKGGYCTVGRQVVRVGDAVGVAVVTHLLSCHVDTVCMQLYMLYSDTYFVVNTVKSIRERTLCEHTRLVKDVYCTQIYGL